MESLAFLAPLLFIAGVAVIVLVAVAIVQDLKQDRKYGYRQAFYTIVALVMLVMAAGSAESLLVIGFKEVMPTAKEYRQGYNLPPAFYLTGVQASNDKPVSTTSAAYTCTTDCQFTTADKQAFADWKTSYASWKDSTNISMQTRKNVAGALSLLIISLPLYLFFARGMNRGSKEEAAAHMRPSPLRSVYFYGVSFGGLVVAVVGGAFLLNTLINVILKTSPASNSAAQMAYSTQMTLTAADSAGIDSVIACGAKCDFSAVDVALATSWKQDWQTARDKQDSNTGARQNDLANAIPLVLIGLPLFWFHFARIRKETAAIPTATPPSV